MSILAGQKEIEAYIKMSWKIIRRWIHHRGFPAKKIDGTWYSEQELIKDWVRMEITLKREAMSIEKKSDVAK